MYFVDLQTVDRLRVRANNTHIVVLYILYMYTPYNIGNRVTGVADVEINIRARNVQICPSPRWSSRHY